MVIDQSFLFEQAPEAFTKLKTGGAKERLWLMLHLSRGVIRDGSSYNRPFNQYLQGPSNVG